MSLHFGEQGSCLHLLWGSFRRLSLLCAIDSSYLLTFPIYSQRSELVLFLFFVHFHQFFAMLKFLYQLLSRLIHHRVTRLISNRCSELLCRPIHRVRSSHHLSLEFSELSHEPHIWLRIGSFRSDKFKCFIDSHGVCTHQISCHYCHRPGQACITMDENFAARPDCFGNKLTTLLEVFLDVRAFCVLYRYVLIE